MRITLLGAPGSGKGMQAKLLAAEHRVAHITATNLLRAAADAGKLSRAERKALKDGRIDDGLLMRLLEARLHARDAKRGFIIDGFPRNIPQAQALDALLGTHGHALQISLHISASESELAARLAARLICGECGATFNRAFAPPKKRGVCDDCGGKIAAESRGGTRTAAARIKAYVAETEPLLAYYKAQHKLRSVTTDGDAAEVRQKISDIVDLEIRPLQMKTLETAAETETFDEEIHTIIAGGQINRVDPPHHASPPPKKSRANIAARAGKIATRKSAVNKLAKKTAGKKRVAKKSAGKAAR